MSVGGEVISLSEARERRESRERPGRQRRAIAVAFYFDLADPETYLAADRVERMFPAARWCVASADVLSLGDPWAEELAARERRDRVEDRARDLHLALSWPLRAPRRAHAANRAAALAAECGRGAAFAVAASRLAYCGGFDLDDPEVLAEAAAAADLPLEDCLAAARDVSRDGPIEAAALRLLADGADRLPAVRVGRAIFGGEDKLHNAHAFVKASA